MILAILFFPVTKMPTIKFQFNKIYRSRGDVMKNFKLAVIGTILVVRSK